MVGQARPGPSAALSVVLLLFLAAEAAAVSVTDADQLLAALSRAAIARDDDTVLTLQGALVLSSAAAANYTLPFVISGSLTLQGGRVDLSVALAAATPAGTAHLCCSSCVCRQWSAVAGFWQIARPLALHIRQHFGSAVAAHKRCDVCPS